MSASVSRERHLDEAQSGTALNVGDQRWTLCAWAWRKCRIKNGVAEALLELEETSRDGRGESVKVG